MRTLCLFAILVCVLSGSVFAATIATWVGPEGFWREGSKWDKGVVPPNGGLTGDEIKITNANTTCTIDTAVGSYGPRVNTAAGSTLEIVEGGSISVEFELRFGDASATGNGSIGYGVQTGGTAAVRDLVLGRYSSNPERETGHGHYTISGGTLTTIPESTFGRMYIGSGINGGYCEGTFTVIGTGGTVEMRSLRVGNNGEAGSNPGKGTLAFVIDEDGVSPITLVVSCFLTFEGLGNNSSHLEVSASGAPPAEDIVLVNLTGGAAVQGVFDTMNGGPAHEGAEVIIGDKIYALTYQYAVGGGAANDIALVFLANFTDLAHDPSPASGAAVETDLAMLSWTNPEPNLPGNSIFCDVYLGTEPNRLAMDKVELGADVSSVAINTVNFPNFGALQNQTTYYWVVNCHDASFGPEPRKGMTWSFFTDDNAAPTADAGPDPVVWLGMSGTAGQETVTLYGQTSDDGLPNPPGYHTVLWTQVATGAPTVVIMNNDQDTATVTFTERGVYAFLLTADDTDKQATDTVTVTVGSDACDASHLFTGDPYHPADVNQDCIVDIADFVELIAEVWLECTDTLTNCGN